MNEIRELTEMEVEAVSGGVTNPFINVPINVQTNVQNVIPVQTAIAFGGDAGNAIGSAGNIGTNFGFQL
jgi:outer membrane receptor protein involved in Fe transport